MTTLNKIGVQVFWSIAQDAECHPSIAERYFGEDRVPDNNSGAALSKAVKLYTKSLMAEVGMHELSADEVSKALRGRGVTYKDTGTRSIAIVKPYIVDDRPVFRIVCDVSVDKKFGTSLVFDSSKRDAEVSLADFEEASSRINALWNDQRDVLNRAQIASMVGRFIKHYGPDTCNGVSLRPRSGGVYFVESRFEDRLENVRKFFEELPYGVADLTTTPIYDDESWRGAIETGATHDVATRLDTFLEKFDREMKAGMSKKLLENRVAEATALRERVKDQEKSLWKRAEEFEERTKLIFKALDKQLDVAGDEISFDLETEMAKMAGTYTPPTPVEPLTVAPAAPEEDALALTHVSDGLYTNTALTMPEPAAETEAPEQEVKDQFAWLD